MKTLPNSTEILVFRHGHVPHHLGDIALLPEGRNAACNAGRQLAVHINDGQTVAFLHSASARTRETAEEIALGMSSGLADAGKSKVRLALPRAEPAIRNFQFILDGREVWPTDGMHSSLAPEAEQNPDLQGFWQATDDPIAYWLNHPSASWESPARVAARLDAFIQSLFQKPADGLNVLVTHSGPMRAYLREVYGTDPGEPDYCESFRVDAHAVSYRGNTLTRILENAP